MGNLVYIARVVETRNELAYIEKNASMAIRMYFSKDAMIKESGARQCMLIQDQLLRAAKKLRDLNMSSYMAQKGSIEQLLKKLKGCVAKTVDRSKEYVNYESGKSA